MAKTQKKRINLNQEKDLARVLWVTLVRWGLLPERDNSGVNLKCPLMALAEKWHIPAETRKNICLECPFKECVLYE